MGNLLAFTNRPKPDTNSRRFMIHVNRADRPTYPPWVKRLVYPELERIGPEDFNLSTINRVLNLQDGLAIMQKPKIFYRLFGESIIPLFGSVVEDYFGGMYPGTYVPRLRFYRREGKVKIEWLQIRREWLDLVPEVLGVIRVY